MQTIYPSPPAAITVLKRSSFFARMSDPLLEELAHGATLRRYERGEVVCWQGEPCTSLYIIQKGSVKLFRLSARGRELIVRTFSEGATFNEVPVFDNGANVINVATLEESEIWAIDAQLIHRLQQVYPEMNQAVIENLTANLRMLIGMVEELSFFQVTNRLARLISQLPSEQLEGQASLRLTQDHLAARLGTVREVVARALRELERSGAIRVDRRQILVLDPALLHDWAQEYTH